MTHKLLSLIKNINKTHKGLGQMIALNILAAKAKKTVLNVAPAGCGKSVACTSVSHILSDRSKAFTSLTLAGLMRIK